jgi:hypothetical protein
MTRNACKTVANEPVRPSPAPDDDAPPSLPSDTVAGNFDETPIKSSQTQATPLNSRDANPHSRDANLIPVPQNRFA